LIKEEEVVGLDLGMSAAAAESRQCSDAGGAWRRDIEDAKSFALESRPCLVDAGSFDGSSNDLAGRGSQSTNKLSHGSRFYLTRRISRSSDPKITSGNTLTVTLPQVYGSGAHGLTRVTHGGHSKNRKPDGLSNNKSAIFT